MFLGVFIALVFYTLPGLFPFLTLPNGQDMTVLALVSVFISTILCLLSIIQLNTNTKQYMELKLDIDEIKVKLNTHRVSPRYSSYLPTSCVRLFNDRDISHRLGFRSKVRQFLYFYTKRECSRLNLRENNR